MSAIFTAKLDDYPGRSRRGGSTGCWEDRNGEPKVLPWFSAWGIVVYGSWPQPAVFLRKEGVVLNS